MKGRLALIVLLLVILPTALLSLLASRVLRSWETILDRRLESSAQAAVHGVAQQVSANLDDELRQVTKALAECIEHGAPLEEIRARALRIESAHEMVQQVYLFMNPWGWLWPEERVSRAQSEPGADPLEILAGCLRREIASSPKGGRLSFAHEGRRFLFLPVRDHEGVYAGFAVGAPGFQRQLAAATAAVAGADFTLVAKDALPSAQGPVLVEDPFGAPGVVREETLVAARRPPAGLAEDVLAQGRLNPPFESVTVTAFARDPLAFQRAGWLQRRLFGWSIAVLAAVVAAGVWLMVRETAAAIGDARSRTDYVAGISHDLRTPIASMKMLAESLFLGHVASPETQRQFLETIMRECERLSQLAERVLFFVRLDQHALVFRMTRQDAGALTLAAVDTFLARYVGGATLPGGQARGAVPVEARIEPDLPPVRADPAALTQVLLNLLDNAAKYGRAPGAAHREPVRVSVERTRARRRPWRRPEECVRLSVQDFGPGIPRRERRRIFRRFYRTPGSADDNVSGVGLGLALCRHVVRMHRGWIDVESAIGRGSVFSVYLPAAKC